MGLIVFSKNIFKLLKKGYTGALKNYRYYSRWQKSLSPARNAVVDKQAWLTFAAIDLLKKNIRKGAKIFEFGGGGSTLFFLKFDATVVTVEHNKEWFDRLKDHINSKNWEGHFVPPDPVGTIKIDSLQINDPGDYYSDDSEFKNVTFKSYSSLIDKYPGAYFDIVLIDGRSRTSCIKHSLNKIKPGGYLILDNAEREYYLEKQKDVVESQFDIILNDFGAVPYSKSFSKTAIWKKKS